MERLLEILSEIKEDVDFSTCTTLIDDGILDSFDILQIISALNEEYDISIPRIRNHAAELQQRRGPLQDGPAPAGRLMSEMPEI